MIVLWYRGFVVLWYRCFLCYYVQKNNDNDTTTLQHQHNT